MLVLRVVVINLEVEVPLSLIPIILRRMVFEGCSRVIELLLANHLIVIHRLAYNISSHSNVFT